MWNLRSAPPGNPLLPFTMSGYRAGSVDETGGECAHLYINLRFFTPFGRTCANICHKQFLRGKAEPLVGQL